MLDFQSTFSSYTLTKDRRGQTIRQRMATKRAAAHPATTRKSFPPQRVGIVGLGLMGQGIATCLLAHGHTVVGLDEDPSKAAATLTHATSALAELKRRKLLTTEAAKTWRSRFHAASNLAELARCSIVLECVREDLQLKRSLFAELERVVPAKTILASNTSSIPISILQAGALHPERFIGMHWGEPAQIPGTKTGKAVLQKSQLFGVSCGKEPAVLNQDVRGFLSNRMMYAMLREACYLVEAGIADVETVDQSFRNDIGWWALLAGPFRWMDLTGIPAYATVMEGVFPELDNTTKVPAMMQAMVKRGAQGTSNRKGFYPYNAAEAEAWQHKWEQFTYEMRAIAERYTPSR
jgi:3-hydroxybutyryl-CoA dehydrogenase